MNQLLRSDPSKTDTMPLLNTSKHEHSVHTSIKTLLGVQNEKHHFNPNFLFSTQRSAIWFELLPKRLQKMGYSRDTYLLGLAAFDSVLSRRSYSDKCLVLLSWACLDLAVEEKQFQADQIKTRQFLLNEIGSEWFRFKLIRQIVSSDLGNQMNFVLSSDFFRPCFQIIKKLMTDKKPNLVFLEDPEESILISDLLVASHSDYEIRKFSPACIAISILMIWQRFLKIDLDWLHLVDGLEGFTEDSVEECICVIRTSYFEKRI